jgi:hypothetical protein
VFFLIMALILAAVTVLGELLRPKPKYGTPQPSALGDFQLPTAEEGRAVSYLCGTCKIKGGNVTWWGDLRVDPIKKHVRTGLFSSTDITTGYRYSLGMQYVLCLGPIDALVGLEADGKVVPYNTGGAIYMGPWSNNANYSLGSVALYSGSYYRAVKANKNISPSSSAGQTTWQKVNFDPTGGGYTDELLLTVAAPDLFGGDEKEGGLAGILTVYRGTQTQSSDAYLTARQGRQAPAFQGVCYVSLQQFYMGTSNYLKTFAFMVKRCPNPFGYSAGGAHDIDGDANAALAIYELLTSPLFGLGRPSSSIDRTSFETAAATLKAEGLGISMLVDAQASADALIGEMLRHVDGIVYTDPATGLWTIKLARADYDPATLLELTQDQILEAPDFARASWAETSNEVKVRFVDRNAGYTDAISVPAQDLANISVTGQLRSDTIDFRGLSNASSAALVALRALKVCSYPLAKVTLKVNRMAWALRPGSCFKFSFAPFGITSQVFRAVRIAYGELLKGTITVEAVEDVFGLSIAAFTAPPSGWHDPVGAPSQVAAQTLVEVPYHFATDGIRVLTAAARGDGVSVSYDVYVNEGLGFVLSETVPSFCPTGILATSYSATTAANDLTGFTLQVAGQVDVTRLVPTDAAGQALGANLCLVDSEWMSFQTITVNDDLTVTIAGVLRGVLDTVPADHNAGARVWFISDGAGLTREAPYPSDVVVTAKLVPRSTTAALDIATVSQMTLQTASRAARPYPPGNVLLSGQSYFPRTLKTVTLGDITLAWAHRNRVTATAAGVLVAQDVAGSYTPEGVYQIDSLVGGVVHTLTASNSGTSQTYTALQRFLDDTDGTKTVQLKITPVNGALTGTARTTPDVFRMSGFGMGAGLDFGGWNA